WAQISKALLLMLGTVIISFMVLAKFNFNLVYMFSEMKTVTEHGADYLKPGLKYTDPLGTISLMIALVLGTAGLPHILMSLFTATWVVGIFYVLTVFLGFGAAAFVGSKTITSANTAGNMAAPLLAEALGGDFLLSFVSAVAFATILAVVAGLVLSGASAFAHD